MTVNTTNITSGPYVGNGLSDEYSYTFRVSDKTQLSVYETDDQGVQTLLTVDTDYTVDGIGDDVGGTITRSGGNLPTDYTWYIRSNYIENQLTEFSSQGGFFPDVHEAQMDHLTFLIQQQSDTLNRTIRLSDSDTDEVLQPVPVDRADTFVGFDSDGELRVSKVVSVTGDFYTQSEVDNQTTNSFATLAALQAAGDNLVLGKSYKIDERTLGNGGGAWWKVIAKTTENGFDVVSGGASFSLMLVIYHNCVDVVSLGAIGDGVADDTVAIQTAIDYGFSVTLKAYGTHLLSSDLHWHSNQDINLNGATLKAESPIGYFMRNDRIDLTAYNAETNTIIRNGVFDFESQAIGIGGIGIAHTLNCTIKDIHFKNATPANGLHLIDACANKHLTIEGCVVTDHTGSTSFQIDQAATGSMPTFTAPNLNEDNTGSEFVRILNNNFNQCGLAAIHIHKSGHSDLLISGNTAIACGKLVLDDTGYSLGHARVTITNNLIDVRGAASGNGLALFSGYNGLIITNNQIKTVWGSAIIVDSSADSRDSNQVVIANNNIDADNNSAIYVKRAKRISITGNNVEDYGDGASTRFGIYAERVFSGSITGNNINSNSSTLREGVSLFESLGVTVENNNIARASAGIKYSTSNSGFNGKGIIIQGNTISACTENGVNFAGFSTSSKADNFVISNNSIDAVTEDGIHVVFTQGGSVSNNQIRDCGATFNAIDIVDSNSLSIDGNYINNPAASITTGIQVSGSGFNSISNNRIKDATDGIITTSGSDRCVVLGNITTTVTTAITLNGANNQEANNIDF